METSFTNVTFKVTEKENDRILNYANSKGITTQDAVTQLVNMALSAGDLNNGQVHSFSNGAQNQIRAIMLNSLAKHDEQLAAKEEPIAPLVLQDNETIFRTTPEIKDIIGQINVTREKVGLGPLEMSIAELLLHWSENLADHGSFKPSTGISYDNFESIIKTLALKEREANGCASNLVERSGSFLSISTYKVVDVNNNQ